MYLSNGLEIFALQAVDPSGTPWVVSMNPSFQMDGKPISPIPLSNLALSTSGDYQQSEWHLKTPDGKDHYHFHIIDPLQAQPLEKTNFSIAAAIVSASTCMLADALGTAAMVFPTRNEAEKWAQEVVELYPEASFWILAYDIKPNQSR